MSDDPRMGGGVVARHAELIGYVTLMWSDVHAQVGQLFEDFCAGRGILNKLFCYPVRYPKLPVIDAGKGIKQYPHQADIEAENEGARCLMPRIGMRPDKCWLYCIFVAEKRYF